MLESLSQLDTNLFFLINHLPHNLLFDYFFGALTFVGEYGAIWFLLSFILFLDQLRKRTSCEAKFSVEAKKLAIFLITGLTIFLADYFLKHFFGRLRPEFVLKDVILVLGTNTSFSFPSGHAMSSFAFAYLLVKLDKLPACNALRSNAGRDKLGKTLAYSLAVLIAFSRIYLGQHYPLDVLAGAFLGLFVGFVSIRLVSHFRSMFN